MSEVDEAMMIIFKVIGGSLDVIKSSLQSVSNIAGGVLLTGSKAVGNVLASPLKAGKEFATSFVPNMGKSGQVSVKTLTNADGDTFCVGTFKDEELKKFKKELKKFGVEFCAIKNKGTGEESILIKAQNAQVAQEAIKNVAKNLHLLTDEEISQYSKPEISQGVVEANPKIIENVDKKITFEGLEWSLSSQDNSQLEYISQSGVYDLKANSAGEWEISKMGQVVDSGRGEAGLSSAMLASSVAVRDIDKPKKELVEVQSEGVDKKEKKIENQTLNKNMSIKEKKAMLEEKKKDPQESIAYHSEKVAKDKSKNNKQSKTLGESRKSR